VRRAGKFGLREHAIVGFCGSRLRCILDCYLLGFWSNAVGASSAGFHRAFGHLPGRAVLSSMPKVRPRHGLVPWAMSA